MISTGIYVRVSTEEQAKEGYSIRAQEEKLRAYATLKDWHIYSVYADEGISGKDIDGRPGIRQLIADVTSGKVNNVLVYKIDRLTRSTKNLIELVELFNQQQCAFNSLQESIDTSSATGRMFLKIVGIFAEFERENLAERVRFGLERKAKEGYVLCNYSPSFGYVRENGNKVQEIDESEAAIVRRIFDLYLNGDYNYTEITDILIAENVPTKKGGQWVQTTIKQILTNPNYIGKVRYGMDDATRYFEADGHHEPIIDETTFYQVQDKIGKVKRISRTKQPRSDVYFCGLLYCKTCGGKYTTHWLHRKGNTFASYGGMVINEDCCKGRTNSHKKVEAAFEKYIANIEDLGAFGSAQVEAPPDNSAEIATIAAEIRQIEKKTEEIMSLFVTNTIDFETYQGMVKVSNERRGELQARSILLESAQAAHDVSFTAADIVMNFRENWAALDNEQRQAFLHKFVKKIMIHSEKAEGGYFNDVLIDEVVFNEF